VRAETGRRGREGSKFALSARPHAQLAQIAGFGIRHDLGVRDVRVERGMPASTRRRHFDSAREAAARLVRTDGAAFGGELDRGRKKFSA
jgi:hypothetical protein